MTVYTSEEDLMIMPGNEMTVVVSCNDAADLATGGGYATPATATFNIKASLPHFSGSGWTVIFDNEGTGTALVTAFVRCADVTP